MQSLSKTDPIPSHKHKLAGMEIVHYLLSGHSRIKLDIGNRKRGGNPKYMEMSTPLNHTEVKETSRESLKYYELAGNENTPCQNLSNEMQALGTKRNLNSAIRVFS